MTSEAVKSRRFIHSTNARILAAIIALAFALLGFLVFYDDLGRPLMEVKSRGGADEILEPYARNEAVAECRRNRIAEINALAEQGVFNEADAEGARSRAITMCSERN